MMRRMSLLAGLLIAGVAGCKLRVLGSTADPAVEESSVPRRPLDSGYGVPTAALLPKLEIPVVVFHEICPATCTAADTYGVSQDELDRILTAFDDRAYHTISMAEFARARAGDSSGLPDKPLLITFDDGRQDAYVGADPLLAKHGMQATMFVITNGPSSTPTFYMSWSQIQDAAASGRWTMQLHAHAGHVEMPVGVDAKAQPIIGSFYGNLECEGGAMCPALETHDAWRLRVTTDIDTANATLASKLGSLYTETSFAVPYGDFGQYGTNDPRIPEELRAYFDMRFEVWFTQPSIDPPFMSATQTTHEVARYRFTHDLGAKDVAAWLDKHDLP